jgi:hypothetical protein
MRIEMILMLKTQNHFEGTEQILMWLNYNKVRTNESVHGVRELTILQPNKALGIPHHEGDPRLIIRHIH